MIAKGRGVKNGRPIRMLGVFVDVTDRYRVELALQELSGRFLSAQEQERSRLARELHDDVGQRLAMHAVETSILRQRANDGHDVRAGLATLANGLADSGTRLHQFAVSLHPARLEQLGFNGAIHHMCQDISEARGIDIDLSVVTLPEELPAHVTLCLYRCLQEALHNVVKHSGSSRASVTLSTDADMITLRVMDEGVGFDPADRRPKDSLGLVSMRERTRLVSGRLTLTSKRGEGTCVEVQFRFIQIRRRLCSPRAAPYSAALGKVAHSGVHHLHANGGLATLPGGRALGNPAASCLCSCLRKGITALYFAAALVRLERGRGVLAVLLVSPLSADQPAGFPESAGQRAASGRRGSRGGATPQDSSCVADRSSRWLVYI